MPERKKVVLIGAGSAMFTRGLLADLIVDGSATDGRHPATGAKAYAIISLLGELITNYETNGNAKLNQILQMASPNRG